MAEQKLDRLKAIDGTLSQIERQFGKGSIMRLGAARDGRRSTRSPPARSRVDVALGVGGIPRGRVIEIYGPESSGKTTLALHVIAEAQKRGGVAAFIDAEHALDAEYARKLGVDIDNLLVSQPDTGEQALEIAEMLVRSERGRRHRHRLGRGPRAQGRDRGRDGRLARGPAGAPDVPGAAQADRASSPSRRPASIFINQIREKIGVMFGNPETTTGGRALKFYASVRIDIRRIAVDQGRRRRSSARAPR